MRSFGTGVPFKGTVNIAGSAATPSKPVSNQAPTVNYGPTETYKPIGPAGATESVVEERDEMVPRCSDSGIMVGIPDA